MMLDTSGSASVASHVKRDVGRDDDHRPFQRWPLPFQFQGDTPQGFAETGGWGGGEDSGLPLTGGCQAMLTTRRLAGLLDALDASPWDAAAGRRLPRHEGSPPPLYTPEERRRRDCSPWTLVQGFLAPVQFVVFLVSLGLVFRYLATGEGFAEATASVIVKTSVLYTIMVTGCVWEKEVFGRYLFAPSFYWEDVFSILVLALHTAYLAVVLSGIGDARAQMLLALAAYAAYLVNAVQFVLKLRAARRQEGRMGHLDGMRAT